MTNPDLSACPENCFRPVGLVLDGEGKVFMSSDSTGEIWVLRRTGEESGTPTSGSGRQPSETGNGNDGGILSVDYRIGVIGALVVGLLAIV
jgi:hypothetical protein